MPSKVLWLIAVPTTEEFSLIALLPVLLGLSVVLWHGFMALLVFRDAGKKWEKQMLFLDSPVFWSVTTFIFGLFGIILYWLMHHSILVKTPAETPQTHVRRQPN